MPKIEGSKFDDFAGYYVVLYRGLEVARWAPSPQWSDFATTYLKDNPDYSYTWVSPNS